AVRDRGGRAAGRTAAGCHRRPDGGGTERVVPGALSATGGAESAGCRQPAAGTFTRPPPPCIGCRRQAGGGTVRVRGLSHRARNAIGYRSRIGTTRAAYANTARRHAAVARPREPAGAVDKFRRPRGRAASARPTAPGPSAGDLG